MPKSPWSSASSGVNCAAALAAVDAGLHVRRFSLTAAGGEIAVSTVQSIFEDSLEIYRSGLLLGTSDYTQTSSRVATLAAAATAGQVLTIKYFTYETGVQPAKWVVPLALSGTFAAGRIGVAYSSDLTISGGDGAYSNPRVTSGALPAGLALSVVAPSTLRLSGTPTAGATSSFTVSIDSGDLQTATLAQSITITQPYGDVVLASAPTAYWPCDEASGTTLTDKTGNGYSGVISTDSAVVRAEKLISTGTGALKTTERISAAATAPCPPITTDWTIEAILYEPGNGGSWPAKCAISGNDGGWNSNGNPAIFYNNGWAISPSYSSYIGPTTRSKGLIHAAMRKRSGGWDLLINGVVVCSGTTIANPGSTLYILGGGPSYPSSYSIIGSASDVAYYSRAVPDSELLAHAKAAGLAS